MKERILVVEDQNDLAFGIRRTLEHEGYVVECADDGADGLALALENRHDLVVLDLMLPSMGGFEVLDRMRKATIHTPVLVLTALAGKDETVRGLRTGADDYLTKPFAVAELLARIEALLRRADGRVGRRREAPATHVFGTVTVDVHARVVMKDGQKVAMTPRELDLLLALLERPGVARTRHELLRDVWGHRARVRTRTVDTHVAELRRKLEADPSDPRYIVTVRKHGYRFEE